MKRYMRTHQNCPYYDRGEGKCVRQGCLFVSPCLAVNEPLTKIRHIREKRGKKNDTRRK